ncbi:hypothetical protein BpHYR1_027624 [Brachionus plicatilis]|uniref:Uncharacterized protein n=1 Tax=Brachionus plicatilis TaxID=10195 RepID=A0A3M7RRH7_BRAPC|nr:hypothetical protein BpHYR1_027624 [Brachionus plicatilis]
MISKIKLIILKKHNLFLFNAIFFLTIKFDLRQAVSVFGLGKIDKNRRYTHEIICFLENF